jgi:hypothetical protein
VPYVIVRSFPLVEELADAANFHVTGSLWLPRGHVTKVSTAEQVGATIRKALLDDSLQGNAIETPAEQLDLTEAVRRAARVAGARTGVRATSPAVTAAYRKVSGWLGVTRPPALELYERLAHAAA